MGWTPDVFILYDGDEDRLMKMIVGDNDGIYMQINNKQYILILAYKLFLIGLCMIVMLIAFARCGLNFLQSEYYS